MKMLLSSSDLSRVKVIRRDQKAGNKQEWILDCSKMALSNGPLNQAFAGVPAANNLPLPPDLWLRNNDVIEVPEKP